jgi:iron(III)-enterobactin esterase
MTTRICFLFCLTAQLAWAQQSYVMIKKEKIEIYSAYLNRKVALSIVIPKNTLSVLNLVLCHDGQDFDKMNIEKIAEEQYQYNSRKAIIFVGIHANEQRLQEYGTASQPDYAGRGNLAHAHSQFVVKELIPYLTDNYKIAHGRITIAGFSLGGLSALDIAWAHPRIFGKIGVFSGSLWWRQKAYQEDFDEDNDRIMHNLIKKGKKYADRSRNEYQQFWFQAGTEDEKDDRNKNGIIDAIDDTLDLIKELKNKGFPENQIHYEQVEGGQHNVETWARVFPNFLRWAFPKK